MTPKDQLAYHSYKEDLTDQIMWLSYKIAQACNFGMGNMSPPKKIEALQTLIDYFKDQEHYEICLHLKIQIEKLMRPITVTTWIKPKCQHRNGWNKTVTFRWWIFTFRRSYFLCIDCHDLIEKE